jgi:hypothetical protein
MPAHRWFRPFPVAYLSYCGLDFREDVKMDGPTTNQSGETWARADLFFLKDALEHGMSFADVAGFLGRTELEVREKADITSARGATNGRAV